MFSPVELTVAWLVTFVASATQSAIGFGLGVVSVPVLTLVNPALTPIPQIFLSLPMAAASVWRERRHLDIRGVGFISAGRVPGSILGAYVLARVSERNLDAIIGFGVLAAVIIMAGGITIPITRASRLTAGFLAGFSGTTSAIGGPPIALLYRTSSGQTVRSTMGAVITIGLVINLVALYAAGAVQSADYTVVAVLSIPMIAGYAAGSRVKHFADGRRLALAILSVSSIAAIGLVARAFIR
jgi:uncharacterized membrane protein YfcA